MSTRCHILFCDGGASLLTYKHSDGYPEGVIPLLREFWKWYPRTDDLEYLTATWFYYCKRQTEEKFCKPRSEEKFRDRDWENAPMATDELNHNHLVALSYGVCADGQVHGDTEHFYEVDIENETVTHYTPESWGFLDADSPADIVSQEPKETYQLRVSNTGNKQTNSENPTDSQIASDGGIECSPEQDTVDLIQGELGDDHEYTEQIREYTNEVIHGDDWALSDVDLSKVTFETRKKARRQHGVADYQGNGRVRVGISEHTIENAGFDAVKDTIRHELVHVWQYQHRGETVELPNGTVARDVNTGHTGNWYEWEDIMGVQRTESLYSKSSADYKYRIWCASCHQFRFGMHRMCKTVKHHSADHGGLGWCGRCDGEGTDGSTFVVTDNDDEFYDSKEAHSDW